MNHFDFLSDTPKFYIFQQESNKTKFGGLLFILYLFLVILIALYYMVHYIKNDKYEIENFRSIKKRRLSHFDNIKIHKAKRISPLKTDREKRNHTTEQNEQKFKRIHEFNAGDGEITTDFDDFNQIDEFLYRIKLKRGKNINPMGLD